MSGIIYQTIAQVGEENKNAKSNVYIDKVASAITSTFARVIESGDMAALEILASSLTRDINDFFSKRKYTNQFQKLLMTHIVKKLARNSVEYASDSGRLVRVEVPMDAIQTLQRNIYELSNYEKVYSAAATNFGFDVSMLHDVYVDPSAIGAKEQILMLLTGNKLDIDKHRFSYKHLKDNVTKNLSVELFTRSSLTSAFLPTPPKQDDALLHAGLPSHYLGVQHLANYYCEGGDNTEVISNLSELASKCLQNPNPYLSEIPDQELHIKYLTASNSIEDSVETYLAHIIKLEFEAVFDEHNNVTYDITLPLNTFEGFIGTLNKDVILTRAAVDHIDRLCLELIARSSEQELKNVSPRVIAALDDLFSRTKHPYTASTLIQGPRPLVTLCCMGMPLKGISQLWCLHANHLHATAHPDDKAPSQIAPGHKFADSMCKWLPDEALFFIVENTLINKELLLSLLFDNEKLTSATFRPNPEFNLKQFARVCAQAERAYPKLVTDYLAVSKTQKLITEAEDRFTLRGFFEKEFHAHYYKDTKNVLELNASDAQADMSFITSRTL